MYSSPSVFIFVEITFKIYFWLLRLDDQHVLLAVIILLCKRVPEPVGEHVSEFLIIRMLVKRDSDVTYF